MNDSKMYLPFLLSQAIVEVLKQKTDMALVSNKNYEFKIKVNFDIKDNCLKDLKVKKIGFKRV
jgi:hypothetical protein